MDKLKYVEGFKQNILNSRMSMFNYSGEMNGLNKFRIERKLALYGSLAIVKIGDTYSALRYSKMKVNEYWEPIEIQITDYMSKLNGRTFKLPNDYVVIVNNNIERLPLFFGLNPLFELLENISVELDNNMRLTRTKIISNSKHDLTNEDNTLRGDSVFIKSDIMSMSSTHNIGEMIMTLEDKTTNLLAYRISVVNQILTNLGYDTNDIQKKERMITDEVGVQNQLNADIKNHLFEIRQLALDEINQKWNLDIRLNEEVVEDVDKEQIG